LPRISPSARSSSTAPSRCASRKVSPPWGARP
jgi:hypothetical protein